MTAHLHCHGMICTFACCTFAEKRTKLFGHHCAQVGCDTAGRPGDTAKNLVGNRRSKARKQRSWIDRCNLATCRASRHRCNAIPRIVKTRQLESEQFVRVICSHRITCRASIEAKRTSQSWCMSSNRLHDHAKSVPENTQLPFKAGDVVLKEIDLMMSGGRCMNQVGHSHEAQGQECAPP